MTEQQRQLFISLQDSNTGILLAEYIEGLLDTLCDIRNMKNVTQESVVARVDLSRLLEKELLAHLRKQVPKNAPINQFN